METSHRIVVGDSRRISEVDDGEVDLVVTSPPYPMIEMWDDVFAELNPEIGEALDRERGGEAFDLMHGELERTWEEVERVLADGGIACVNVGDATRKLDEGFRVYPNHARVVDALEALGFDPLPDVLWRKPANSAAKFMGSGMLPPNAYATLEHEYVLIFRKGARRRSFEPGADRRYEAAYFWEERNEWFSDVWTDVRGVGQSLADAADQGESWEDVRERSGAFPFEIPYRLINMYSVYGDTVLDPFWGTGTTSLAAMVAGRNSIGYELEAGLAEAFDARAAEVPSLSREVVSRRLERHEAFVRQRREEGTEPGYEAENYDLPVMTDQERRIQFYAARDVERSDEGYTVTYEEF